MASPYSTYQSGVTLGNGQSLGFAKGKGYYAKGQVTDPFAAYTEPAIAAKVKQIVGRLPAPQTDAQITSTAQGMLDPVVKQITDAINARAQAGGSAIGGYTDQLAKNLMGAGGRVDAAYAPAEQSVAATNAALADRLSGAGNATSDALAARLASIGEPGATGAATGAVRQAGAGSGNALYATGNASLDQLIGNHATATDYAGKLPDLARLSGLQQLGGVQGKAQQDIADQTAQVTSQLPSLVQNLRSQSDTRANNRASAATDIYKFLTGNNLDMAKFKRAEQDAGLVATTRANATVTAAQTRADAAANAATIKANEKAAQDAKPNATLSGKTGYLVDSNGNWIPGGDGKPQVLPGYTLQNGRVVKAAKAAGGGAATGAQVQSFLKGLTTYKTVTTKTGTGSESTKQPSGHQMDYMTAYKWLRTHGSDDPTARADLAGIYKRGEDGRAWLTNEEQTVLKQAQSKTAGPRVNIGSAKVATVTAPDGTVHKAAYLTPAQTQVLRAAGKLPKGEWSTLPGSSATVYWIFPGN